MVMVRKPDLHYLWDYCSIKVMLLNKKKTHIFENVFLHDLFGKIVYSDSTLQTLDVEQNPSAEIISKIYCVLLRFKSVPDDQIRTFRIVLC